MLKTHFMKSLFIIPVVIALVGCQQMPGTRKEQGAVIGGAAGAAVGAAVAKDHRVLGALIGGLLGAGGGYIIGAKTDKIDTNDQQAAATAARKAQENPATAADAQKAMTADLNYDGFVTMDEVVAMKQAGFSDAEIMKRLRATDQIFELTADQEKFLLDRGLSQTVVTEMQTINKAAGASTVPPTPPTPVQAPPANSRGDVIGQPK